jgi:uncharacterized membrane protein
MTENLVQHRSGANVWDRRRQPDTGRWLAAATAAVCLGAGVRRRSAGGLCLAIAGAALVWWAAGSSEERSARRAAFSGRWRQRIDQIVDEASADSFPASDAPALSGRTEGTVE